MSLDILSLNAWGGRLHAPLMDYLADCDPDVLCLQEVTRTIGPCPDWLVYRDDGAELPQRANLFADVRSLFPAHDAFFLPCARGHLFDGDIPVSSEFGLATFVRQTLPVIGQAADFVHGAFSPDGWGAHPRSRNAHGIRIFRYKDGSRETPVTIFQMHGLRDPLGKGDSPERSAQTVALITMIQRIARPEDRIVVCGDFNVLPESAMFDALHAIGLVDLVTSGGFTDTRTSHYKKDVRFADYMLVSAGCDVAAFDVVSAPEVSDHRALRLRLSSGGSSFAGVARKR